MPISTSFGLQASRSFSVVENVPSERGRAQTMAACAVPVVRNAASKATVFMVGPPASRYGTSGGAVKQFPADWPTARGYYFDSAFGFRPAF